MASRRTAYNPLETSPAPRWYVVRSMHGTVIEARPLAAGTDLTRVFVLALLAWLDEGWSIGEFSSAAAAFFCQRGVERLMVSIDPNNPHEARRSGAGHLSGACGASPRR